jgi:hypothetical protein
MPIRGPELPDDTRQLAQSMTGWTHQIKWRCSTTLRSPMAPHHKFITREQSH